ncbi:ECF-type sigma factor (plasmid) [Tundrisphaera lichenicola]|uniref:ECF-type sigma factor n=1 Tax=Tundrisphaera lichenicola TaxID=2029860 RepID=UPI003EC09FC7
MESQGEGSVTRWIGDLKSGGDSAALRLWERYFERLVHLARKKLQKNRRARTVEDEEDAALSAFDSLCRGVERGRFPRLTDREDLWRLLVVLTVRKALDQIERRGAARRGGGHRVGEFTPPDDSDNPGGDPLDRLLSSEPTPELAAMVIEQHRRLRDALGDATLCQILDLRLEGYTREEIAERMGCAVASVKRKLDMIRQTWLGIEA